MKILVLGASGMLGHRIWFELSKSYEIAGVIRNELPIGHNLKKIFLDDVTNFEELRNILDEFKPDLLLNCVGLIKQAPTNNSSLQNIMLNSVLPLKLTEICKSLNCRLILFSTDCVFSGTKGMYVENDFCDADDVYGRSKKLGEVVNEDHVLTIRTSIIGRELRGHGSLVDWFLKSHGNVKGFKNAIFSGLPTKYLANVIDKFVIPDSSLCGLYHISTDPISKYDLLNLIKDHLNLDKEILPQFDFKIDRSLNSDRFRNRTGFHPLTWNQLIPEIFPEDIPYGDVL